MLLASLAGALLEPPRPLGPDTPLLLVAAPPGRVAELDEEPGIVLEPELGASVVVGVSTPAAPPLVRQLASVLATSGSRQLTLELELELEVAAPEPVEVALLGLEEELDAPWSPPAPVVAEEPALCAMAAGAARVRAAAAASRVFLCIFISGWPRPARQLPEAPESSPPCDRSCA